MEDGEATGGVVLDGQVGSEEGMGAGEDDTDVLHGEGHGVAGEDVVAAVDMLPVDRETTARKQLEEKEMEKDVKEGMDRNKICRLSRRLRMRRSGCLAKSCEKGRYCGEDGGFS